MPVPHAEAKAAPPDTAPIAPTQPAVPAEEAPAAGSAEEAQTRALRGKLWSRKRQEPVAAPEPTPPSAVEEPVAATQPTSIDALESAVRQALEDAVAEAAALAEATAEEAEQRKEARRRWRWPRRATAREPESPIAEAESEEPTSPASSVPTVETEAPEAIVEQAAAPPEVAEPIQVPQAVEPPVPQAAEAPVPHMAEPPELPEAPAIPAEEVRPEPPKLRLRKQAKPLPLPEGGGDARRAANRRSRERESAEPLAPIDIAPPKVYLPPPPEVPEAPAASVAPPSTEPASSPSAPERDVRHGADTSGEPAPDPLRRGESAEEFLSLHAAQQWSPPRPQPPTEFEPTVPLPELGEKKGGLFKRMKKPKVKVSNGFEYTVPSHGPKKRQPVVTVGPAPQARREINCPRCGQPSPRGLCEVCEDALSQLRQLTEAFLEE